MSLDRSLLRRILSDAHIIDVDWSEWDKLIRICALADNLEPPTDGRKQAVAIDFVGVTSISVAFNHVGLMMAPHEHVQWRVDDFALETTSAGVRISFWGLSRSPKMDIVCQQIRVEPFSVSILDELFPDWDRPSRALARPSLEKLAATARRRRR